MLYRLARQQWSSDGEKGFFFSLFLCFFSFLFFLFRRLRETILFIFKDKETKSACALHK